MSQEHPDAGDTALDRYAENLDASGLTLDTLRADYPGWVIWWHEFSGCYHAHRRVERFTETEPRRRRFHVAAVTPGRLAVMLLAQYAMDCAERAGATGEIDDGSGGQLGDGRSSPS